MGPKISVIMTPARIISKFRREILTRRSFASLPARGDHHGTTDKPVPFRTYAYVRNAIMPIKATPAYAYASVALIALNNYLMCTFNGPTRHGIMQCI